MFRHQIQKFQRQLRRGVNRLYGIYIASVLRRLEAQGPVSVVNAGLKAPPAQDRCCADSIDAPVCPPRARQLKLRGDFGCARVREQLWLLQHLHPAPVIGAK